MIISIGIFSVLVVAAIGVMIGVSNAQIKAANVQATQDNIRFSMDLMTKEIRTGFQYELSSLCAETRGEELSFITSAGEQRVYYRDGERLMRLVRSGECARARPLMADEVVAERVKFRIGGASPGSSDGQPWATIMLTVRSKSQKQALESVMNLETTVISRLRDL